MPLTKITRGALTADIIDSTKLADNAVDTEHLADDAVEAAELASDAVVNASVASGADIATSKISGALTSVSSHGLGSLATLSTVAAATITDNSVGADELNVSGDGSSGQALLSDADGTFSWGSGGDSNAGGVDGSAGTPAFSFTSDPDTGMYNNSPNELGFTTGGSRAMFLSAGGSGNGDMFLSSGAKIYMDGGSDTYLVNQHNDMISLVAGGTTFRCEPTTFKPTANGTINLGASGDRWQDVWCTEGAFNDSDLALKTDVQDSALGLGFINRLTPISYKWKDRDAVLYKEGDEIPYELNVGDVKEKKRTYTRTHYGLAAQQVKSALDDLGIDTKDFAAYSDGKAQLDDEGNKIGKDGNCALRYTEFISPMIKAIQELSAKVEALENA